MFIKNGNDIWMIIGLAK